MDKVELFFKCIGFLSTLHRPKPPEIAMPDPEKFRVPKLNSGTILAGSLFMGGEPSMRLPPEVHVDSISMPTAQSMPTTSETVIQLRRRLLKELYRVELDLIDGARIASKPCDCLDQKHNFGLEATAEELIPMDNSPVYGKILTWLKKHQPEFTPENISKHQPEYYQSLVGEVRAFRKEIPDS